MSEPTKARPPRLTFELPGAMLSAIEQCAAAEQRSISGAFRFLVRARITRSWCGLVDRTRTRDAPRAGRANDRGDPEPIGCSLLSKSRVPT
jgi:hypothetical protein